MRRILLVLAAATALAGLSACETATPYQPLHAGSAAGGGYSDAQLAPDRWRVSFRGNSLTSRATVESYLLYRAAELTTAQGFDWFDTVERETGKTVETFPGAPPIYGPYGYGWRPYWRYYGGGYGWRGWDPYGRDPFWADDIDARAIERFEASAEIVMHHGPRPAGDRRALDAREVMANLGPHIVRPK